MNPAIGIVGFGDFAKLLVTQLAPYAEIVVSTRQKVKNPQDFPCRFASVREVLAQDVIIPSIPSQFLEDFIQEHKKDINPTALIMEVCSVKVKPVEILKRVLPKSCQILATHPLFGPVSAAGGIQGLKMMMYPVRIPKENYQQIKQFAEQVLGLKIIECTPEEHDKMMAYSLGLSHYIGRALQEMDIPETELSTQAYDALQAMRNTQGKDSWDLFESIMMDNPYALNVNKSFKQACQELDKKLRI